MIRGMLEKGSAAARGAKASMSSGDDKSSTSTTSSGGDSSASGNSRKGGRPTSSSEDATTNGGFRDSTVPIAKSISQSATKIFRSIDRSTSTDASTPSHGGQNSNQGTSHHPLHSSRQQNSGMSSSASNILSTSSSNTSGGIDTSSSKANKKCTMCVKSFNPLRRRYYCRTCPAQVCSHCSIARKVDSLEGSISIRICMACKLSTINSADDDHYERVFSVSSGIHPNENDNGNGAFTVDRASSVSYVSTKNGPQRAQNHSSSSSTASTPDHMSRKAQTPASAPGGLRRTSSSASTKSAATARSRRDSFGSTASMNVATATIAHLTDCPMCMNEACGPLVDISEVPYPAMEVKVETGSTKYIRARALDNERERLGTVRKLRKAIIASPQIAQRFSQLCSMAAIATQCPIAVIGLVDRDDYYMVFETGLTENASAEPAAVTTRNQSLAAHTCRNGAPLVCSDLSADVRFAGNPWRRDTLKALFYAGIPLTLANGHTIGVIEVFDTSVRFACMDVVTQLQAVVRGLLKKFEEILVSAITEKAHSEPETGNQDNSIALAIAELERNTSYTEVKPSPAPLRSPVRGRAPAPPAPPTAPLAGTTTPVPEPAPEVTPVVAPEAPAAQPTENEMEMQLMKLLSQTTDTQKQLQTQQTHMVHAITSHSKQISEMAKQLERMEQTLSSKLDGAAPAKEAATAPPTPEADPAVTAP
uniref:FYVE-type domain-containing protein n=1 Tax=Globisporangium ultimum (strain ATCC 200006 / CBS 805.95 / DAOM BR144) TaxID=431595 RepID=K3X6H7_GLOUD